MSKDSHNYLQSLAEDHYNLWNKAFQLGNMYREGQVDIFGKGPQDVEFVSSVLNSPLPFQVSPDEPFTFVWQWHTSDTYQTTGKALFFAKGPDSWLKNPNIPIETLYNYHLKGHTRYFTTVSFDLAFIEFDQEDDDSLYETVLRLSKEEVAKRWKEVS